MILKDLTWTGAVVVNGVQYESLQEAAAAGVANIESIRLLHERSALATGEPTHTAVEAVTDTQQYVVEVRGYMTRPAQPGFDFMKKWNNNEPMPLRVMVGTVEKETPGMVYMNLHGDIIETVTPVCMKCGKPLTNPVSQYFGMGPECGNHDYTNPFASDAELKEAVRKYRTEYLRKITWSGWIIKNAITRKEPYNG